MAVPMRLLTEGEEVVAELRPHWLFLARPLGWAVLVVAATVALVVAAPSAPAWVLMVPLTVLAVLVLWLLGRLVRWRTTAVVVTTGRIVQRSGVVARRGLDLRLDRVNELSYHQNLVQRLLGAGTVVVETSGEAGMVVLGQLRHPAEVQRLIGEQVAAWHLPGWPPQSGTSALTTTPPGGLAGPVRPRTVGERLQELHELHRRGLVSDEEFADKRRHLLDQL